MIVKEKGASNNSIEALRWLLFIIIALIINLPIIATILTSFKTTADINSSPPIFFFSPTLSNYIEVLFKGNTIRRLYFKPIAPSIAAASSNS